MLCRLKMSVKLLLDFVSGKDNPGFRQALGVSAASCLKKVGMFEEAQKLFCRYGDYVGASQCLRSLERHGEAMECMQKALASAAAYAQNTQDLERFLSEAKAVLPRSELAELPSHRLVLQEKCANGIAPKTVANIFRAYVEKGSDEADRIYKESSSRFEKIESFCGGKVCAEQLWHDYQEILFSHATLCRVIGRPYEAIRVYALSVAHKHRILDDDLIDKVRPNHPALEQIIYRAVKYASPPAFFYAARAAEKVGLPEAQSYYEKALVQAEESFQLGLAYSIAHRLGKGTDEYISLAEKLCSKGIV